MTIKLGSNIDSLKAQEGLQTDTSALEKIYTELSSGLRINSASDDAAGLAIAMALDSKARIYSQGIRNINDGISAANIVDGSIIALKNITTRQQELAEQASNGSYTSQQRTAMNTEANALVDEFNRILKTTTFNGIALLAPPAGTGNLVIQAGTGTNGAIALSTSVTTQSNAGSGTFSLSQTFGFSDSLGSNLAGIVEGDFSGDGKLDLIESHPYTYSSAGGGSYQYYISSVLINNGSGSFSEATQLNSFTAGTAADFNGDGKLDLATLNTVNATSVTVDSGSGNGHFSATASFATSAASSITSGQIAGSGNIGIVTGAAGTVRVLAGNGDGTFKAQVSYAVAGTANSVQLADLQNDGAQDIIAGSSNGNVYVLLGNSNGSFNGAVSLAAGATINSVATGDINGDGILDIVAATTNGAAIFLGNGNGTFNAATHALSATSISGIQLLDNNGDGKADIVAAGLSGGYLSLGNGDGTFAAKQQIFANRADHLVVGDFNGDGSNDIATNYNDSTGGQAKVFLQGVSKVSFQSNAITTQSSLNLLTQSSARAALSTISSQQDQISSFESTVGAFENRLQIASNNLQSAKVAIASASSMITNADIAGDSSAMARLKILQDAATAVLAQANQEPALALILLKS